MDLCVMEEIVLKLYPDYRESLESVFIINKMYHNGICLL